MLLSDQCFSEVRLLSTQKAREEKKSGIYSLYISIVSRQQQQPGRVYFMYPDTATSPPFTELLITSLCSLYPQIFTRTLILIAVRRTVLPYHDTQWLLKIWAMKLFHFIAAACEWFYYQTWCPSLLTLVSEQFTCPSD